MDELELINNAKLGNKSALNSLFIENYPILKGYVIKMTGDLYLTEDVVQETLLKAAVNINKFIPKAKFSTWLITIATNIYRDTIRKNKHLVSLDEAYDEPTENIDNIALTNLEYKEVVNILQQLPYEKRAVFILKHYYNYKYEEIAKILDCPVGTVRSRLHNCIKIIISELEKRGVIYE